MMFDIDNPARDILELSEWLSAHSNERHMFRGQTRYYPTGNSPSNLRKFSIGGDGEWTSIDKFPPGTVQDCMRAKAQLASVILPVWGKAVGNLICQQYGISSDAYDMTSDLDVAIFFATRSYPYYEPLTAPLGEENIGVIYRISINRITRPTKKIIEDTLLSLYQTTPLNSKVFFNEVRNIMPMAFRGEVQNLEKFLIEKFSKGFTSANLYRPSGYLNMEDMQSLLEESWNGLGFKGSANEKYRDSRSYAQRGGLYFPPTAHTAFVSSQIRATPINNRDFRADPSLAWTMGATKVYDINANPFVEKFFFKHTDYVHPSSLTCEILWPNAKDEIFYITCEAAREFCREYLEDYGLEPDEFYGGVVDPGYLEK